MKSPIYFIIISLLVLSSCADNPSIISKVVSSTDREQMVDKDLSEIALNYLTKNSASLGINNARSDLQIIKIIKDEYQTQHIKFAQLYKNIPVWASELIVHIKNNKVTSVSGGAKTIRGDISVVPALSTERAEQSAFNQSSGEFNSQLMILAEKDQPAVLVYKVQQTTGLSRNIVFVDASNGEVIKKLNAMPNTLK